MAKVLGGAVRQIWQGPVYRNGTGECGLRIPERIERRAGTASTPRDHHEICSRPLWRAECRITTSPGSRNRLACLHYRPLCALCLPDGDPDARRHYLLYRPAQSPAQKRVTPVGRLVFVCVQSNVYLPVPEGAMAPPAQAICDYVYLSRRHGAEPEALVTFRNLARIQTTDLPPILARYPVSVQKHVERLLHSERQAVV